MADQELGSAEPTQDPKSALTKKVGRYALLRKLGAGGMGVVYAGYDEDLDRKVAVKLLHESTPSSAKDQTRFLREAQAMAQISHPNVVNVFEVGESEGRVFIAMEFLAGQTLAEWQQSRHSWEEVLRLYLAAGEGLHAAHRAGLVHRDFKPDNVLLGQDGRPRVTDFGLARVDDPADKPASTPAANEGVVADVPSLPLSLTATGAILGTPAYMSPEQHQGQLADSRSDQWSFCAALYEALYGRRPFAGDSIAVLAFQVVFGKLRLPPRDTPVPPQILETLQRGLAQDASQRFPSMAELLAALAIDPERDPAAAPIAARRFFTRSFSLTIICCLIFLSVWRIEDPRRVEIAWVSVTAVMFLSGLVLSWLLRGSLMRNSFHRGIIKLAITLFGLFTGLRGLEFFLLKLRPFQVLSIEFAVTSGFCAVLATRYLPSAWILVVAYAVGSVVMALFPFVGLAGNVFNVAGLTTLVLLWNRAARQNRTAPK